MIAYNNLWLDNMKIHSSVDDAFKQGVITDAEKKTIKETYPVGFYTPNIFIRIGLFVLTNIIASFSFGLFALLFLSTSSEDAFSGMLIFFSLITYAAAEFMIRQKHHFCSGVDDALIWMTGLFLISGINVSMNLAGLGNSILIFFIAGYFALRFADRLMSVISYLAALGIVFFLLPEFGIVAKRILPFVLMFIAAATYFIARSLSKKQSVRLYYHCLDAIKITSLLCFSFAGNYYIVREAGALLLGMEIPAGAPMPFGWLFWFFTIVIPILYIARGIQKKDYILLRTGLILVALVVWTVRFYYHIMPLELVMIIGGAFFILFSYGLIRYLAEPKHGFTYKEPEEKKEIDNLNLESLVIAQTFHSTPAAEQGFQFGGGSGGGAGAGGSY